MKRSSSKTPQLLSLASVALLACHPGLAADDGGPAQRPDEVAGPAVVRIEPAAPLDRVPVILRLHVRLDGPEPPLLPLRPDGVFLIVGEVGSAHLGQLARDEISNALRERIVPSLSWVADDGHVVLAPVAPLEAGAVYQVAAGHPRFAVPLQVAESDEVPRAARIWPPEGQSGSAAVAVWCGDQPLPQEASTVSLEPTGRVGSIRTGALTDERGTHCVRFEPADPGGPVAADPVVPPPTWPDGDEIWTRLDPRPLAYDEPSEAPAGPACDDEQLTFGPACATVADDRLLVSSTAAPLLWSLTTAELDQVVAVPAGQPFWLHPLPTDHRVEVDIWTADTAGQRHNWTVPLRTQAAMAHVVINEVYANPIGAEPQQEWVELYNDGQAPAELAGYVLVDAGGHTPLPPAVLAPAAYALVVNESYDPSDEFDPSPPEATALLQVPKLGKGGLSNQGEPLALRDETGRTVSRFPAEPKPKSGVSVIRIAPMAPDGVAASFARSPGPATPGESNRSEI